MNAAGTLPASSSITLEVCIDDAAGLAAAVSGGADRIELCADLTVGGLTPSVGFMHYAAACGRPVYAMIRPRAGDYHFSRTEAAIMLADIAATKDAGLDGVVIGALNADGELDMPLVAKLAAAAMPLGVTLNRAFDLVADPFAALDQVIDLGISRVLTSGQAPGAFEGIDLIRALVARASGRISIMAGAGVTPANAAPIVERTGITEIHGSFSVPADAAEGRLAAFGFAPPATRRRTDMGLVRAAKTALAALDNQPPAMPALEVQP
jgi:copper homeostasis protein